MKRDGIITALLLLASGLCLDSTLGLAFTGVKKFSPITPSTSNPPSPLGRILCFTTKKNYLLIAEALPKRYEVDHASTRGEAYNFLFKKSGKNAALYQAVISDDRTWDRGHFFGLLHRHHLIPLRLLYSESDGIPEDRAFEYHCDALVETPARLRGALRLLTERNTSLALTPMKRIKFRVRTLLSLSNMRLTSRVRRHLRLLNRLDGQYRSTTLFNNTRAVESDNRQDTIRIVHISDTHFFHRWVALPPEGDLLIHTGDICAHSRKLIQDEPTQLADFLSWLVSSKALERFKQVVFIAGNHDTVLDPQKSDPLEYEQCMKLIRSYEQTHPNLKYLCDSSFEWNGLQIYGTPTTICREETENHVYRSNGFERNCTERLACWKKIPEDVDILLSHLPPAGLGYFAFKRDCCSLLTDEIYNRERRPRLHAFGHIHAGLGIRQYESTILTNGCQELVLNDDIVGGGMPIVLDLPVASR